MNLILPPRKNTLSNLNTLPSLAVIVTAVRKGEKIRKLSKRTTGKLTFFQLTIHCIFDFRQQASIYFSILQLNSDCMALAIMQQFQRNTNSCNTGR